MGERSLQALAVKDGRTAVMSIDDMERVMSSLSGTGEVPQALRIELADKASFEIARHYSSLVTDKEKYDMLPGLFLYDLFNGENPYQVPASVFTSEGEDDPLSLINFRQVSGEPPCFTNMADADAILRTMCLAAESFKLNTRSIPYLCVAAKHGNAYGMGVSNLAAAHAIEKALFGNPRSIYGGEVVTNFPIDEQLAKTLANSERRERLLGDGCWMLDLVMAPAFTSEAIAVLGKRKVRKLFENSSLCSPILKKTGFEYRIVRGGFLRQPPTAFILNLKKCQLEGQCFSETEISSLIAAWSVAFGSSHGGNEVALAKDGALLSAGGGPSTVEAVRVAVARAVECGHDTRGATFAADAFFPFTDAPSVLCDAGVTTGCVPGGGKHEPDVREYFRERYTSVAFLPREFRGFCRH